MIDVPPTGKPKPEDLPSGPYRARTDADIRELLMQALEVRQQAALNPGRITFLAPIMLEVLKKLTEGAGGWVAFHMTEAPTAEEFGKLEIDQQRNHVTLALQFAPLQQPGSERLPDAIYELNYGQADPLLVPAKKRNRGTPPLAKLRAQLHILCWIECQTAWGRERSAVIATALNAANASSYESGSKERTFKDWRHSLKFGLGPQEVELTLWAASCLGLLSTLRERSSIVPADAEAQVLFETCPGDQSRGARIMHELRPLLGMWPITDADLALARKKQEQQADEAIQRLGHEYSVSVKS